MTASPSVAEEPLPVSVYSVAEDVSSGVLEFSAQAEKMRRTARAIAKAPPQTEGRTGLYHRFFPLFESLYHNSLHPQSFQRLRFFVADNAEADKKALRAGGLKGEVALFSVADGVCEVNGKHAAV